MVTQKTAKKPTAAPKVTAKKTVVKPTVTKKAVTKPVARTAKTSQTVATASVRKKPATQKTAPKQTKAVGSKQADSLNPTQVIEAQMRAFAKDLEMQAAKANQAAADMMKTAQEKVSKANQAAPEASESPFGQWQNLFTHTGSGLGMPKLR